MATPVSSICCVDESVFYLNSEGHIIQLISQNNSWYKNDLTVEAKATSAFQSSRLTCESNSVYYIDNQGSVCQLIYQDSQWSYNDLTKNATNGAPLAAMDSPLCSMGNSIYYLSPPSVMGEKKPANVNQLIYSNNHWSSNLVCEDAWFRKDDITALVCSGNSVYYAHKYRGTLGYSTYSNNKWTSGTFEQFKDRLIIPQAIACAPGMVFNIFPGEEGWTYGFAIGQWTSDGAFECASPHTGTSDIAPTTRITCAENQVFYINDVGDIVELNDNNGWSRTNLTKATNAPGGIIGGHLCCLKDRVYYMDNNGHIMLLQKLNGYWQGNYLSKLVSQN